MKIENRLVEKYEDDKQEIKKQEELKRKYNIDENKIVVEKNNTIKFILKLIIDIGKTILSILFIFLAFVGLICLIEPRTRDILLEIYRNIIFELSNFLNWKDIV